jgi:hypothetical protein
MVSLEVFEGFFARRSLMAEESIEATELDLGGAEVLCE